MIRRLLNKHLYSVKVNFDLLKKIRQQTSAPLSQVKTALEQTDNSYDKAIQWLKQKGMSVAQKHSDKSTKQGIIAVAVNKNRDTGVMLQVNCQTDFVAKSSIFLGFVDKLLQNTLNNAKNSQINLIDIDNDKEDQNIKRTDNILEQMDPMNVFDTTSKNVLEQKKHLISKVQENIKIRRMLKYSNPNSKLGYYIHREYQKGIGLQGCLAEFIPETVNPQTEQQLNQFMDNIAIQILGCPPKYWKQSQIPEAILSEHKQTIMKQMAQAIAKAPPQAQERIISGKLKSVLFSPHVFSHMGYVLNSSGEMTVGEYWKQTQHQLGTKIELGKVNFWKCK